jgi:hypothetical protein
VLREAAAKAAAAEEAAAEANTRASRLEHDLGVARGEVRALQKEMVSSSDATKHEAGTPDKGFRVCGIRFTRTLAGCRVPSPILKSTGTLRVGFRVAHPGLTGTLDIGFGVSKCLSGSPYWRCQPMPSTW